MTHDFGYQFYEKNPELHKLGAVLITTIPGFPHIYHREIFPEGGIASINHDMFNFYKKLLKIREKSRAIKEGEIENVWKGGDNVIAYLRKYENESVVVVVNFLNKTAVSTLNLSFLPKGTVLYDELNDEAFIVNEPSNFKISVPAYGARILTLMGNYEQKLFNCDWHDSLAPEFQTYETIKELAQKKYGGEHEQK